MVAGWLSRTAKLLSWVLGMFISALVAEPTLPSHEILTDRLNESWFNHAIENRVAH